MDKRMLELLRNAARCFEECYSPFVPDELAKMNVTSDECGELSSQIADIIMEYVDINGG